MLLVGCGTPTESVSNETEQTQLGEQWIDDILLFVNDTPVHGEFVEFLKTLTPEQVPVNYGEILAPEGISSPVKIVLIKPKDFATLGYQGKFYEEGFETEGEQETQKLYLMFYRNHATALVYSRSDIGQFGKKNENWFNDFFLLTDPYGDRILMKNFQEIIASNIEESYLINSANGDMFFVDTDTSSEDYYERTTSLRKNGEAIETTKGDSFDPLGIDVNGQLVYAKYFGEGNAGEMDWTFTLKKENGEVLDNWLINSNAWNEYNIKTSDNGNLIIGREHALRTSYIEESVATITPEILKEIDRQKLTLLHRYHLIDQQRFKEAYQQLKNPQRTLKEFTEQREKYDLVSVETIKTPLVFFKSYGGTEGNYLKDLGNYNQFSPLIFTRNSAGEMEYRAQIVEVIDNRFIQIVQPNSQVIRKSDSLPQKELLTKLYYHLIATQRLKEAWDMELEHQGTLEEFENSYQDVIGIDIKDFTTWRCDETGSCSTRDDNPVEWPTQILLDMIRTERTDRYHINNEVINGKLKYLETIAIDESDEACLDCRFYN